jgi:hypothetical protein
MAATEMNRVALAQILQIKRGNGNDLRLELIEGFLQPP